MSVDAHGDGNANEPGGRSKAFAAGAEGIVGGGAGWTSGGAADGRLVGFDSVADGDGERPLDDGQ